MEFAMGRQLLFLPEALLLIPIRGHRSVVQALPLPTCVLAVTPARSQMRMDALSPGHL